MCEVGLDVWAVLGALNEEPGAEKVYPYLPGALLSAVNAAEVAAKLVDKGVPAEEAGNLLDRLGLESAPFEPRDVVPSASVRVASRAAGLSLGDRACLTLAKRLGFPALTADRTWLTVDVGVDVRMIRGL